MLPESNKANNLLTDFRFIKTSLLVFDDSILQQIFSDYTLIILYLPLKSMTAFP